MVSSRRSVEKEQFWRQVLAEHAASSLSVRAFCKREAVSEASFHFWRRELASRDAQSSSQIKPQSLVPVRVLDAKAAHLVDDPSPSENAMIEIGIPGGFTLRAALATDAHRIAEWLNVILKVVAV